MQVNANVMPFTETRLWLMEKDKFLASVWTCGEGCDLMPHENQGGYCLKDGTKVSERGF